MPANLDFLNKNTLRNFPLRQGATLTSNEGQVLPNFIIASISLSLPSANDPYISQVAIAGNSLSVGVSTSAGFVGYFQGVIAQDFQTLNLVNTDGLSSGFLITGIAASIQSISGVYNFSSISQSGLEVFTYMAFTPPAVSGLQFRYVKMTGNIGLGTLTNLTESTVGNTCNFSVASSAGIVSIGDKSSQFRNCDTPVITNINGVVPYPVDGYSDDANIYLMGINPLVFTTEPTTGSTPIATIQTTTVDLDLTTFCTLNGAPLAPVNPEYLIGTLPGLVLGDDHGYNNYYSRSQTPIVNFMQEQSPEYLSWPYWTTTYNSLIPTPAAGNTVLANPAAINGTITEIYAITASGSVTFTVNINGTPIGGLAGLTTTSNGLVVLATGSNTFITTDSINFTITAVSGSPTGFRLVVYYAQEYN